MIMKIIDQSKASFEKLFVEVLGSKQENHPDVDATVKDIIATVIKDGDAALAHFSMKFDRIDLSDIDIEISRDEIDQIAAKVPQELKSAIDLAAQRIQAYHEKQKPSDFQYQDDIGANLGMRWTAMQAAGLYVPGGTASYPSSVLMNAIPAKVAPSWRRTSCCCTGIWHRDDQSS